jgi:hypothetical protein
MVIPLHFRFFRVSSRDFLLAHSFTGSTATSGVGSLGIGVNGTHPSGVGWFIGAGPLINPVVRNMVRVYKPNS